MGFACCFFLPQPNAFKIIYSRLYIPGKHASAPGTNAEKDEMVK